MRRPPGRTGAALTVACALVAAGLAAVPAVTAAAAPAPAALAADSAASLVAGHPAALHIGTGDVLVRKPVIAGGNGLQFVPYERTYHGLPVLGGDFVVVTNRAGQVMWTSPGAQNATLAVGVAPKVAAATAASTARSRLKGGAVSATSLVIDARSTVPRLAYRSTVSRGDSSRLSVVTDALTGAVISATQEVVDGTGTGWINGPTPVTIQTSGSGSSFSMTDPTRSGISCRNYSTGAVLTGTDDVWGNGNGTSIETGCVDALFDVQHEWDMLGGWLGRSGINGSGNGFPIRVGLNDLNAFWNGSYVAIGHNQSNQWISSEDVVGHEFGHAIDSTTPGGQSGNGVSEATGDIFGTSLEFYTNEPGPYDTPDFVIGEEINLVGTGPIRDMTNPGNVGDPVCYSSSIPTAETHAAAGPFDHWFYLVSGGQAAAGGSLTSKCNGATVSGGLGVHDALRVFYNAMLSKTSGMTYLRYRTATLNAAKSLFSGCAQFNTVKAAWDAVNVPVQSGDPTCTTTGGPTVNNPGNKTGTVGTAITPFTVTASGGTPPYTWSATGLPAGVSIGSSSGTVSGTPTTAGTYTVTVTATGGGSGSATFTFTISPSGGGSCSSPGQKLGNPGFESGNTVWSSTAGVIDSSSGEAPHSGSWKAWLDGYGTTHTDTLSQSVSVPAGCTVTITYWLHIDSSETTTTTQYDKLTAKFGATTLATYSNLNKASGYSQKTFTIGASASAQTSALAFTGTEDVSLQTSFVLDDLAVTLS